MSGHAADRKVERAAEVSGREGQKYGRSGGGSEDASPKSNFLTRITCQEQSCYRLQVDNQKEYTSDTNTRSSSISCCYTFSIDRVPSPFVPVEMRRVPDFGHPGSELGADGHFSGRHGL